MPGKKKPRRTTSHRGVKVITKRRAGRVYHVARWKDPRTETWQEVSFRRLGITNADGRAAWAKRKAETLTDERKKQAETNVSFNPDAETSELVAGALAVLSCTVRPATLAAYKRGTDALLSWTAETGLNRAGSLTQAALTMFPDWLLTARKKQVPVGGKDVGRGKFRPSDQPLSPGGVNVLLRGVRVVLTWLAKRSQLALSVQEVRDALDLCPVGQRDVNVLDAAQVKKVLNAAMADTDPDAADFCAALLLSGCRFSEMAKLDGDDVNKPTEIIRLTSATKSGNSRVVDLRVSPSLLTLLARRSPSAIFPGLTKDRAKRVLRRLNRRSRVKFSWHDLRRTCGSFLACAPFGGAYVAAARLGHGVQVAERHYLRRVFVEPEARTIEQAMGCEDLFERIAEGKAARVVKITDAAG